MNINFLIAGDSKYFHLLRENVAHVRAIYPTARVFVFDFGLRPDQRAALQATAGGVEAIDWRAELDDLSMMRETTPPEQVHNLALAVNTRRRGIKKRFTKFMLKRFPGSAIARRTETEGLRFENLLIQNIRCMRRASELCPNEPLVFLDADAILFAPIDELFGEEADGADVTVTLMDGDHNWQPNRCLVLNSGVIAFGANTEARNAFIDAWWEKVLQIHEWLREQTAMVRLLESHSRSLFAPYRCETLNLDGCEVRVRVVPCGTYNYCSMENRSVSEFPADAKIYHFTNRAQEKEQFAATLSELKAYLGSVAG